MSHIKTELIDTEKLLNTKEVQVEVFVYNEYQELFDKIVNECSIQIVNQNSCIDDIGTFYTLQFANVTEVYWFGRNYGNEIKNHGRYVCIREYQVDIYDTHANKMKMFVNRGEILYGSSPYLLKEYCRKI